MATIHKATLNPSKLELLSRYLRKVSSIEPLIGDELAPVGAYRFDDPDGEVGIETHILTSSSGITLQVPLTYRSQPLAEAEPWLVGTMEHSVLGKRWVYNGCGDSVYLGELFRVIMTGGTEVAELVQTVDGPVERKPSVNVRGSGNSDVAIPHLETSTTRLVGTEVHVTCGDQVLRIRMALGEPLEIGNAETLTGTWALNPEPVVLASIVPEPANSDEAGRQGRQS